MSRVERTDTRITGVRKSGNGLPAHALAWCRELRRGASRGKSLPPAVKDDDPYAWPPAFSALADHVRRAGENAAACGHHVSARDHFLRASMYYRSAEYFADPFGREGHEWGRASRETFIDATKHMAEHIEVVEVPFEGKALPGYFMTPAKGAENGRTVLILTGFDGTGEELYFQSARAGLERGFNVRWRVRGPCKKGCVHPRGVCRAVTSGVSFNGFHQLLARAGVREALGARRARVAKRWSRQLVNVTSIDQQTGQQSQLCAFS